MLALQWQIYMYNFLPDDPYNSGNRFGAERTGRHFVNIVMSVKLGAMEAIDTKFLYKVTFILIFSTEGGLYFKCVKFSKSSNCETIESPSNSADMLTKQTLCDTLTRL